MHGVVQLKCFGIPVESTLILCVLLDGFTKVFYYLAFSPVGDWGNRLASGPVTFPFTSPWTGRFRMLVQVHIFLRGKSLWWSSFSSQYADGQQKESFQKQNSQQIHWERGWRVFPFLSAFSSPDSIPGVIKLLVLSSILWHTLIMV